MSKSKDLSMTYFRIAAVLTLVVLLAGCGGAMVWSEMTPFIAVAPTGQAAFLEPIAVSPTPNSTQTPHFESATWLNAIQDFGPLSPIAMSPFFGITVLSGMAQVAETSWGAPWLADNSLVTRNPILKHPVTFWIFLVLTLVTSLPRLTKVSKPFAQALDWIESYSVLFITLVMFGVGWAYNVSPSSAASTTELAGVAQAGILSLTFGGLLMVAAIVNFLIVKSVRFMFEMLVWISPFPFVDALFEFCNKTICFGLIVLYTFSPLVALILNILIFAVCLVIFRWAKPRMDYYWHFWIDPLWQWLFPSYRKFDGKNLWLFAEQNFGLFRKYDRLHVYWWEDRWMMIRYDLFWRQAVMEFTDDELPYLETTGTKLTLVLQQQVPLRLATHRGYIKDLDRIAAGLKLMTHSRLQARNQRLAQAASKSG